MDRSKFCGPWKVSSLLLLLSLVPNTFLAAPSQDRPTVGLVLGGGGARGFAHIGVLEYIEENQIPVDYVAGTSMGALIGGLYAMGWSPAEIRELVASLDWNRIFSSSPPFDDLLFRRKEDTRQFPVRLELGWREGFTIPSGLNPGTYVSLLLDRLTLPYSDLTDFSKLPIPFACVATDLVDAREVELNSGSLSRALRATMAIPGFFSPVKIDHSILVDGGLLNNLPADLAKARNLDIVIAVDVGTPLSDAENLRSVLDILDQSLTAMILDNVRENLKFADLLLVPELGDFGTVDFGFWEEISSLGYEAAQAKAPVLDSLRIEAGAWRDLLHDRQSRVRKELPTVTDLRIEGMRRGTESLVRRELRSHGRGRVEPSVLEEDLLDVYGIGLYDSLHYEVQRQPDSRVLVVNLDQKDYGPPFFRFGLSIQGVSSDELRFGLRSRTTFFDLGRPASELRLDFGLGTPLFVRGEYYLPLSHGWFVAAGAGADRTSPNLFERGKRVSRYRIRTAGAGVRGGYGFGRSDHEITFGYQLADIRGEITLGEPILPMVAGTDRSLVLRWRYNGQDRAVIPASGFRVEARYEHVLAAPGVPDSFDQGLLSVAYSRPTLSRGILFFQGEGGTTFARDAPPHRQFTLGGPLRLGAYQQDEFRGSRLLRSNLGYLHRVASTAALLGVQAYIGGWYENGTVYSVRQDPDFRHNISSGLILDTFGGPIFFGLSVGEQAEFRLHFSLGGLF